jgi:hypothetical protein
MNKHEIEKYLNNLGVCFPNKSLVHFANVSSAGKKNVWWFEIPCEKAITDIDEQLSLILHKAEEKLIYHLVVPMQFIHFNSSVFAKRKQQSGVEAFCLELSLNDFQDIRPNGSNLSFKHFIHGIFTVI